MPAVALRTRASRGPWDRPLLAGWGGSHNTQWPSESEMNCNGEHLARDGEIAMSNRLRVVAGMHLPFRAIPTFETGYFRYSRGPFDRLEEPVLCFR